MSKKELSPEREVTSSYEESKYQDDPAYPPIGSDVIAAIELLHKRGVDLTPEEATKALAFSLRPIFDWTRFDIKEHRKWLLGQPPTFLNPAQRAAYYEERTQRIKKEREELEFQLQDGGGHTHSHELSEDEVSDLAKREGEK